MKMKIQFAIAIALLSGPPAMAAEITTEDCSAIRDMGRHLATANLEATESMLAAHKKIVSLMADSLDNPALQEDLVSLSKTLKTKDLDKKILVKGLTALNKACPL